MGLASSLPLSAEELSKLRRDTKFTIHHLIRLYRRFVNLDTDKKGHLSREDFMEIPLLAQNAVREQVVDAFFLDRQNGRVLDSVDYLQFVMTMAVFRPAVENSTPSDRTNSRKSKLAMTFRLIDADGDGKLSKEELLNVLRTMVRVKISEDQLSRIADRAIEESDTDGDGYICLDEFIEATKHLAVEERLSLRFML